MHISDVQFDAKIIVSCSFKRRLSPVGVNFKKVLTKHGTNYAWKAFAHSDIAIIVSTFGNWRFSSIISSWSLCLKHDLIIINTTLDIKTAINTSYSISSQM